MKRAILMILLAGCGSNVPAGGDELVLDDRAMELGARIQGITSVEGVVYALGDNTIFRRVEGEWSQVWSGEPGLLELLDIVALGEDRFALTTRNMGYELDLSTGLLTEHFCYEPGEEIPRDPLPQEPTPTVEISRSVAYAAEENLIVANPQTITDDVNARGVFSEVAIFDRESGQELRFVNLRDAEFSAGGLVVLDFPTLIAGEGSKLVEIDFETGAKREFLGLAGLDVSNIEGLAIDRAADELLVLDGTTQRLLTLDLEQVLSAR